MDLVASPVNPADLLIIQGLYAILPELPGPTGMEGVGRVAQRGEGVSDLSEGDLVLLPPHVGAWRAQMILPAAELLVLPPDVDPLQLAMLGTNPLTAQLLLSDMVDLSPGDWVIQNAANSAVGRYVIQLARARGLRSVNVVRREGLQDTLSRIGADIVLTEDDDLPQRVAAATQNADIRLALDATAGPGTMHLASCLGKGGTVVNYGVLTMQPCQFSAVQTIFEDKRLRGFWIDDWYARASRQDIAALLTELSSAIRAGTLVAPVEATYPLAELTQAVARAARPHRSGKVLVTGPAWSDAVHTPA